MGALIAFVSYASVLGQKLAVYFMLRDETSYKDPGGNYFDERSRMTTVRRAAQRIERLGYKVTLEAA